MTVNGVKKEAAGGVSLAELLKQEGFEAGRVAGELNGEIGPKALYGETFLSETDKLEVVSFVGGG